ncbi:MAG TPA: hypothetical protein VJN02_04645 [Gammaproteobacteria bacterium]|nr:hypothetical protein [Gammaproteobacteria bacterium]
MNNFHEILGIIAGILALVGYIPYIYTTVRGKTRPNKATWIIWTVIGGLIAFSYLFEGDPNTIWLPLGYFIGPLIVAILSFRYGYSEWTKLDIVCLIVGGISIIPWIISENAIFTLLINVFIDASGAIPTVVKTYREPETEDFSAWVIFFIANTLEVFAIEQWNLAAIYPIYLFILAGLIVLFILKGKFQITLKGTSKN